MHLKVVLQGNFGHFDRFGYFKPKMYRSESEFRELCELIGGAEVAVADELARIGNQRWPEIEVILCNFWCRAPDIDGETIKHYKKDRVLEASTCIEGSGFIARDNLSRCNIFFFRALTLAAAGFRKYKRDGGEIEAVRDNYFLAGAPGEF